MSITNPYLPDAIPETYDLGDATQVFDFPLYGDSSSLAKQQAQELAMAKYRASLTNQAAMPALKFSAANIGEGLGNALSNALSLGMYKHNQDAREQSAQELGDIMELGRQRQQQLEEQKQRNNEVFAGNLENMYPGKGLGVMYSADPSAFSRAFPGIGLQALKPELDKRTKELAGEADRSNSTKDFMHKADLFKQVSGYDILNPPRDAKTGRLLAPDARVQGLAERIFGKPLPTVYDDLNAMNTAIKTQADTTKIVGEASYQQGDHERQVVTDLLNISNAQLNNQLKQLQLQIEPEKTRRELELSGLSIADKAKRMADNEAANGMLEEITQNIKNGYRYTPGEWAQLQIKLNSLTGKPVDFAGVFKGFQNPKAGQLIAPNKVLGEAGAGVGQTRGGWVQAPSGQWYNPSTGKWADKAPTQASPKQKPVAPQSRADRIKAHQNTTPLNVTIGKGLQQVGETVGKVAGALKQAPSNEAGHYWAMGNAFQTAEGAFRGPTGYKEAMDTIKELGGNYRVQGKRFGDTMYYRIEERKGR